MHSLPCIPQVWSSFSSVTKTEERGSVKSIYDSFPSQAGILYLDDEVGSATSYFLSASIPPHHLHPINKSLPACISISSYTGVHCRPITIEKFVSNMEEMFGPRQDLFSCIWLDLMSRTVDVACLSSSLRISKVVKVTLSLRGEKKDSILSSFLSAVKKAGGVVENSSQYKGASDVSNMIRFTVVRRAHKTSPSKAVSTPGPTKIIEKRKGSRVKRSLKKAPVEEGKPRHLVGEELLIPCSQWGDDPPLEDAKVVDDHLVFKVTRKYYTCNKFVVHQVCKDGSVYHEPEKWTISYVDAMRFVRG